MGLSSSKSTTKTTPVYNTQIEGAASNINSAYNAQAPKISGISDQLGSMVPGLIEKYTQGDTGLNAATDYNTRVLNGDYLHGSPELDAMVSQTNDSTRNGLAASLGTRGLTGGSAFGDIITRGLAQNETGLRFNNYNAERDRQGSAAALAPNLSASSYTPLSIIQSILQTQQAPIQAAAGAGAGVGGLLGSYQTGTQTSTPSLAALIGKLVGTGAQIAFPGV